MPDALEPRDRDAAFPATQLADCEARMEAARKAANRHGLFALLGVSPASLLPMIGLGIDFGAMAILGAGAVVVGLETWRWARARAEYRAAEEERTRVLEGGSSS